MKKNYFLVLLSLLILALLFKKLGGIGSDVLFVTSIVLLVVGYVKSLLKINKDYEELKTKLITFRIFLIITLIGILFRHQFWYFPFWYFIFKILWPAFILIVIIQLVDIYKIRYNLTVAYKIQLVKDVLVPLIVVSVLAFPTFFLTTKSFVKIFKSYSYEELINKEN